MRRVQEHGLTRDARGHARDPLDVSRSAYRLLLFHFEPRRDLAVTAALAQPVDAALVLRALLKSQGYLARYLRQPMEWVEGLSLDEFNRWLDVTSDILLEERGAKPDRESTDPMRAMMGDD
jgi:hypothetical protein